MTTVDARTRQELIKTLGARYRASPPADKRRILDEFVALTGYHRKHAIRVLRSQRPALISRSPRARVYDEAVRNALVISWKAANCICGKRLKPLLPVLVPALERHGHLSIDAAVRSRLLAASAATIDRLLASERAAVEGPGRKRALPLGPQRTPARTLAGGKQPGPGHLRLDVVAHGDDRTTGSFVHTLVLADIASGWTECVVVPACEEALITAGLDRLRKTLPFPLRGLDGGHGAELVTDMVLAYCARRQIEFTRPRPRKDDGAAGALQHGSVVRRLADHRRLEGPRAAEALERLCTAFQRFVNFFQPSFKLAEHGHAGARAARRHLAPETPCARLLASPLVDEARKEQLRTSLAGLDPLRLLAEIRAAQQRVAALGTGLPPARGRRNARIERLLRGLAAAWNGDENHPARRAEPRPPRSWRTRVDPFDGVWPRVVTWLEAEPDRTAKELLQRLRAEGLGEFPDRQLRTLQRRVKEWRHRHKRRPPTQDPGSTRT